MEQNNDMNQKNDLDLRNNLGILDDYWITVNDITQYHYCPRKIYFIRTLQIPVKTRAKMEMGKTEHEKEKSRIVERKYVFGFKKEEIEDVLSELFLSSKNYQFSGYIDVVLKLNQQFIPVELKYTDMPRIERHWKKQIIAHSMLIEENFNTNVKFGIIYFIKQRKFLKVPISPLDKSNLIKDIKKIKEIIKKEIIPKKVSTKKCNYCEMRKYC
ncbi:MAG: CRISPR-associated protein Cas4 [Candidatus Helarchaeota archaeon]